MFKERQSEKKIDNDMKLFDKNEGELNDEFVTVTHLLATSDTQARTHTRCSQSHPLFLHLEMNLSPKSSNRKKRNAIHLHRSIIVQLLRKPFRRNVYENEIEM